MTRPDTPRPDLPSRPDRLAQTPLPPIPDVSAATSDQASVQYSRYRTNLSTHRTGLSEHRTDLSEYRTDLSTHRTDLSTDRTEMSMRRTGMSYQRTRMSADRTLMSVLRTSLSLIGFGFTIYQAFEKLRDSGTIHSATAPRHFGLTLILSGILLLVGGIARDVQFGRELRHSRNEMARQGLVHAESSFPISVTLIVALALLGIGIAAGANIIFNLKLFG